MTSMLLRSLLLSLALPALSPASAAEADAPPCRDIAMAQAERLLKFHGEADEVYIVPDVRALAPMQNPVAPEQRFDVLELQGHIYRASYRIRLIYHVADAQCVLMGQEILEQARL